MRRLLSSIPSWIKEALNRCGFQAYYTGCAVKMSVREVFQAILQYDIMIATKSYDGTVRIHLHVKIRLREIAKWLAVEIAGEDQPALIAG
jgi:hypothetical protein